MTIEEKAKDFAGYNLPSAQDIVTTAKMSGNMMVSKQGLNGCLKKPVNT